MHLRAPHDCRNTTTTTTSAVTSRSRSRSDPHSHKTQQKNKSPPSLHRVYASLCQTSRPHSRQTAALTLTHTHFFSTCLRCCYASFPPPFFTSALPTIYFMFSHGTHTLTLYLYHTHTLALSHFLFVSASLFSQILLIPFVSGLFHFVACLTPLSIFLLCLKAASALGLFPILLRSSSLNFQSRIATSLNTG